MVEVMDVDGTPVSHCVGISHRQAGHDMGREIVARGHRRIGFIGTKMPQDFRARKRLDGFTAALTAAGLELAATDTYSGGSSVEQGRNLTAAMLERHPDLDCIYYSSDLMAIGGLMHCLASGLSVPDDLALAGFNDLELLRGMPVRLATTDSHRHEIGRRAARIVLERRDRDASPAIEALTPTLSPGEIALTGCGAHPPFAARPLALKGA
ncbi:substrate-binding domain-containing protein [Jhaorihella thermophila]